MGQNDARKANISPFIKIVKKYIWLCEISNLITEIGIESKENFDVDVGRGSRGLERAKWPRVTCVRSRSHLNVSPTPFYSANPILHYCLGTTIEYFQF